MLTERDNHVMSEKNLSLKHNIGDTLQLQFAHDKNDERYYVKLIGYLKNKSILITTPRFDGVPLKITMDEKFIIRMFSGNDAKVFSASAIHSSLRPYPHLHLTYPTDLQSITVRKAERVNCKLIVTVHNEEAGHSSDKGKSSSMHDISTAGTQLFANDALGEVGNTITINVKVTIADIEQYLTIPGVIRRIVTSGDDNDRFEHGVEFVELEDEVKLILLAFIYEQMMKN